MRSHDLAAEEFGVLGEQLVDIFAGMIGHGSDLQHFA